MTRKKNKAKHSQLRTKESLTPGHVALTGDSRTEMAVSSKRPLPTDAADSSVGRATKRPKKSTAKDNDATVGVTGSKDQNGLDQRVQQGQRIAKARNECQTYESRIANPHATPGIIAAGDQSQALPTEIQHLTPKYNFTTMSIISSSKMQLKVRSLLDRVNKSSFADVGAKPGVVILNAKAPVASKMVGIAEIAKAQIERENGKWWQYSKVEGQLVEAKPKQHKRPGKRKTIKEWQEEKSGGGGQDVEMDDVAEDGSENGQEEKGKAGGDEEEEDAFETISRPQHINPDFLDEGRARVRNVPVMKIYLARVPVPGLKELYGEQTNT